MRESTRDRDAESVGEPRLEVEELDEFGSSVELRKVGAQQPMGKYEEQDRDDQDEDYSQAGCLSHEKNQPVSLFLVSLL